MTPPNHGPAHGGDLSAAIRDVVSSGRCSGCGACTLISSNHRMTLSTEGFLRPMLVDNSADQPPAGAMESFRRSCPGERVEAQHPRGAARDARLGPVIGVWRAWAADPEVRYRGSSGGALTAILGWLVSTGRSSVGVAAAPDPSEVRRTSTTTVTSPADAVRAAGSRYAPVANAAHPAALDPGAVVVGKPCEVSAVRALSTTSHTPLLLSFFCAGVPSQTATDTMLDQLGVESGESLRELRYRGAGWPGRFTAVSSTGAVVSADYEESWGRVLGPTVQWRCKICPDGIAESADVVAGDLWNADEAGYPTFTDLPGVSVLIARTERGLRVVDEAVAAGVIEVCPIETSDALATQPYQRQRRETLAGRLVGARLGGAQVPRFHGFGLVRLALTDPRRTVSSARGAFARVRRSRPRS